MENGQWLIAIFSTDCMFGFGAAKPTGACLLSLSSVFKVWTPFVSRTDSPLTSGRMLLHSLLPQLNKDSECIWSMVLHLWCSNWGTILYILTILSFTVLYCTFEHVLCQCMCVCVCVHMCVCVVVSVELSLLLRLLAIVCLCGSVPACVCLHCLPNVHSLLGIMLSISLV